MAVEEAVLVDFQDQPSKQGSAVSGWILLDYGEKSRLSHVPYSVSTSDLTYYVKTVKILRDVALMRCSRTNDSPTYCYSKILKSSSFKFLVGDDEKNI